MHESDIQEAMFSIVGEDTSVCICYHPFLTVAGELGLRIFKLLTRKFRQMCDRDVKCVPL